MTDHIEKEHIPGIASERVELRPVTDHARVVALARLLATGTSQERRAG